MLFFDSESERDSQQSELKIVFENFRQLGKNQISIRRDWRTRLCVADLK